MKNNYSLIEDRRMQIFKRLINEEHLSYQQLSDEYYVCLLYTSDAADEEDSVDLVGRRNIKKKNKGDFGRVFSQDSYLLYKSAADSA